MNYFLGEIQLFGFNYAPYGWALCNGATVPVSQNTALFSLLGTIYGGNGQTTFQLPNLTNRVACGQGQGPGLTQRDIGSVFGDSSVTLLSTEMPAHTHGLTLWNQPNSAVRTNRPAPGSYMIEPQQTNPFPSPPVSPNTTFSPSMSGPAGQSLPHENRQPSLALNYCIAFSGSFVYPNGS